MLITLRSEVRILPALLENRSREIGTRRLTENAEVDDLGVFVFTRWFCKNRARPGLWPDVSVFRRDPESNSSASDLAPKRAKVSNLGRDTAARVMRRLAQLG